MKLLAEIPVTATVPDNSGNEMTDVQRTHYEARCSGTPNDHQGPPGE